MVQHPFLNHRFHTSTSIIPKVHPLKPVMRCPGMEKGATPPPSESSASRRLCGKSLPSVRIHGFKNGPLREGTEPVPDQPHRPFVASCLRVRGIPGRGACPRGTPVVKPAEWRVIEVRDESRAPGGKGFTRSREEREKKVGQEPIPGWIRLCRSQIPSVSIRAYLWFKTSLGTTEPTDRHG